MILTIIAGVALGVLIADSLRMWLLPELIYLRGYKCSECGKRFRNKRQHQMMMPLSPVCPSCLEKLRSDPACHPPSFTDNMKEFLSDPEAVKVMRKAYGLQTEKEKFEEEDLSL